MDQTWCPYTEGERYCVSDLDHEGDHRLRTADESLIWALNGMANTMVRASIPGWV